MGCSLLGVGIAETAWGLLYPPTGDFVYDLVIPFLMVIFGVFLLLVTNRISLEDESE
jgi:hypothetical protein